MVGAVAAAVGAVEACTLGPVNLCDPKMYDYGTADPIYREHCIFTDDAGCCPPGFLLGGPDDPENIPGHCILPDSGFGMGMSDSCDGGGSDGGDAFDAGPIGSCAEQCLPLPPSGWDNPGLVYIGPELQVPPCPTNAPKDGYEGYADLNAPSICGACQCKPATGSCGLPATITVSNSAACPNDGPDASLTPFDPPKGWDGGCTATDAIDGGQLCDGSPCVESLTIAPLLVREDGCAPTQAPITTDPPSWGTFTRLCRGQPIGSCADNGLVCSPSSAPGFRACVWRYGEFSCSSPELAPYTEKHVFYDGYQDTRSCSACACDPPTGSTCSSKLSIYSDSGCATMPSYTLSIDSTGPLCDDLIPGAALGSKSATPPVYMPGVCQPTGGPMGSAEPIGPSTLCCIPAL